MSKQSDAIKRELWKRGELSWKMHKVQKEMYDVYKKAEPNSVLVWLLSRQTGKCLREGTQVLTPTGPVAIEDIKVGDIVYGYNADGSVSPCPVTNTWYQGEKEVVNLVNHNKLVASATDDHRWMTYNTALDKFEEKQTRYLKERNNIKIVRKFLETPGGVVDEPHAYVLGALLGDGCSKQKGNMIYLSSLDENIPKRCAEILNVCYKKQHEANFTWALQTGNVSKYKHRTPININHYDSWLKGKGAHEKIVDLDVIRTWNRESRLKFLAGLIDTDGSVFITGRNKNELKLNFTSQSKSIIEAVKFLMLDLFQLDICLSEDKRDKYKNGNCFNLYSNNNYFAPKIVKALDPYLVNSTKKWKDLYSTFEANNSNPDFVGVKEGSREIAKTYDIEVGNQTHLFLLANGLVTHNSTMMAMLALETAMKTPNSLVKLVTDTKLHVRTIFEPIFRDLLVDCPKDLQPTYYKNDYLYEFPNGSQVQLAGTDNKHYERLRGQKSHLVLIDEAGFCSDLLDVVKSVLLPTTTHTGGKIVLGTTPPIDGNHEFFTFLEEAELIGNVTKKTVYDNPLLSKEQVANLEKQMGGKDSVKFRREYLCEIIRSEDSVVFPEFTAELEKEIIIPSYQKPAFYDTYVSMDLGFKDLTVILFGFFDFRANKIVIEDEIVLKGKDIKLPELAKAIEEKEAELWTSSLTGEVKRPEIRISDINYIVTQEIARASSGVISFRPAKKDDNAAAVNNMRVMLGNKGILILDKCKTLIQHLRHCKWDRREGKTQFARSVDDGHYDAADACKYLIRHVNFKKNPYPAGYQLNMADVHVQNKDNFYTASGDPAAVFRKVFNVRSKK